jgi:hypothetical protein
MLKKWNIFENFSKNKKLFFANIYQSHFESHQLRKLKAPIVGVKCYLDL